MNVEDYFGSVARSLEEQSPVVSVDVLASLASDAYNGLLKARVWFWDDSYLDLYEVVNTELGYPVRVHYSYAYLRKEQQVFRYDNAPHYPNIITFPHHRHVGIEEDVVPAEQPSLGDVLSEIGELLSST
jgi:hypothetical protein